MNFGSLTLKPSTASVLAATIGLTALAGCDEQGRSSASRPTAKERIGVEVDTIRTDPADLSKLKLTKEARIRISGSPNTSGPVFVRLGEGAWLSDGRIAVLDEGARRLHVFSPAGGHLRSFGGQGGGPGEFKSLTTISTVGDSIYVYDRSASRLSVLHASAGFARSILLLGGHEGPPPFMAQAIDRDRFVAYQWRVAPSFGDERRLQYRRAWLSVLDAEGQAFREPEPFAWTYSGLHPEGAVVPMPYVTRAFLADCGAKVVAGDGHRFRLVVRDLRGEVEREIRWPANRESVDHAELDSLRARFRERYPQYVDLMFAEELLPERRPAIERVECDNEGRLWVGRFEPFYAPVRRWWVLDRAGRPVGRLRLPSKTRLLAVHGNRALLVERDEVDVQHLTVREISGL